MKEGRRTAISSYYAALMALMLSGAMHLTAMRFSNDLWFTSAFSLMPTFYISTFAPCSFLESSFFLYMWVALTHGSDDEDGVKV